MRLLYIYTELERAVYLRWRRVIVGVAPFPTSKAKQHLVRARGLRAPPQQPGAGRRALRPRRTSGPNCAARGRASRRLAPDPPSGTSPGPRLRASRAPSRMTRWRRLGGGGISHVSLFVFEGGGQSHDVREGAVRALARGRVHRVGGVPDEDDATPGARPPLERLPRGSGARRCRRRSPPRARGPRQSQPRARLGPPGR